MTESPALQVRNLQVEYRIDYRWRNAIHDFEIAVQPNQIYGIVGESGSGKSTVVKAIMRYLSKNGRISGGTISLNGDDLAQKSRGQMRRLWSGALHMVPQNALSALNPSLRIGEQIAEVVRIHERGLSRSDVQQRVIDVLSQVRLADPDKIMRRYPHELSGGQQQRVVLAMAFVTSPQLLLLDEPTTSLDVTTEAAILDLICDLIHRSEAGAIYVTHNLGVVAQFCDRVTVMYAGEIMEDAGVQELFARPLHPYTIGLLACIPRLGQSKYDANLHTIPGRPPSLSRKPQACVFAERCPVAIDVCFTDKPPLESVDVGRKVRCHRWQEIAAGNLVVEQAYENNIDIEPHGDREILLEADGLTKYFDVQLDLVDVIQKLRGEKVVSTIQAVNDVNLTVRRGNTYGLVGESGSGKTTLARVIVGLAGRTDGKLTLLGADIKDTVGKRHKDTLRQLQMVFQNPQDSLNPYLRVGQALGRPLIKLLGMSRKEAKARAGELLRAVNLDETYLSRFPAELSGGEKQRIAIARAFASNPELVVCDEPVSSLDVSVQAAVLNLLARLQKEHEAAYLFISHDLAVVGYLADYLAVMYLGELFEVGKGKDMFVPPHHPYTEALLCAVPTPDPNYESQKIRLSSDIPSPRNIPTGCRFHTRCPHKIGAICEDQVPPWQEDDRGNFIKCHIPIPDLIALQTGSDEGEQP